MRIQVLGPICAWLDDKQVDLGPTGQRAVLGLLALAGGQPLPRAELVDTLWGGRPPASAANVIQTYVKHLRRLLEPGRVAHGRSVVIPGVGDGYALRVGVDDVDLLCFRRLVTAAGVAEREGDWSRAAGLLAEGLGLWRGVPLVDVPVLAGHPKVVALVAERQAVLGRLGEVSMAAGDVAAALPVLEEAVVGAALDEGAVARLMRGYRLAGRRAQAFSVFHEARRRLAEELGVDPGPELTAAHTALLHDSDPTGPIQPAPPSGTQPAAPVHAATSDPAAARPAAAPIVPAQLPTDIATFTGRLDYLRHLDRLLPDQPAATPGQAGTAAARPPATAVVISTIEGPAGVGKTTLAVHWAHRVADRFPDGQLYVNLRGFDPDAPAMSTAEAVRGFLEAFAVPAQRLPAGVQAQAALYRSLLAHRRVLVVLDNARDADQVRPLLPGSPGCLVVVTSRNQLSGLVATAGAHPISLGLPTPGEARQLLARRLGADRVAGEPEAVDEIIACCARLPLALAIVAARAATHPGFSLAALAGQLRESRGGLDVFTAGDALSDVRAVLSWSYQALDAEAAQLFRLLGLHPGPDLTVPAAVSLAGRPAAHTRPALTRLAGSHLVAEPAPGRFAMHDLLRAYAVELVRGTETETDRRAATHRLLDHYLHTARAAVELLHPQQDLLVAAPARPQVAIEEPAGNDAALAWLTAEHAVLLAAIEQATGGFDGHAMQLALALAEHLDRGGHWLELAATQQTALQAAHRLDDLLGQAHAHRGLARACARLERNDAADEHLEQAVELYGKADHPAGQARTYIGLAWMAGLRQRHQEALRHAQRALDGFRAAGNLAGQANAQNTAGWFHAKLGSHRQTLSHCRQALGLYQKLGDRSGQADTWDSLGYAHHHLGQYRQATTCYQHALNLYQEIGDRYHEADTLTRLGEAHHDAGAVDRARMDWRRALSILDELAHPDAAEVRSRLHNVDSGATPRDNQAV